LKCLIILNKGRGMTVFVAMLQNQHWRMRCRS
jgi:hypothetical protein